MVSLWSITCIVLDKSFVINLFGATTHTHHDRNLTDKAEAFYKRKIAHDQLANTVKFMDVNQVADLPS